MDIQEVERALADAIANLTLTGHVQSATTLKAHVPELIRLARAELAKKPAAEETA